MATPLNTLDDTEHRIAIFSDCASCANLTDRSARTCRAFPGGIPRPLWSAEKQHRQPYAGDNGIRYEPKAE